MSSVITKGYDLNLVTSIPARYKCPICHFLLRDAVQTFRGELACAGCYSKARRANPGVCPIDGEPIDDKQIFSDKHARRMISQLPCYCKNKTDGCEWEGIVQDAEEKDTSQVVDVKNQHHEAECEFVKEKCSECLAVIIKKFMKEHKANECLLRQKNCQYCLRSFASNELANHESECTKKPRECPYGCGSAVTQSALYDHVKKCPGLDAATVCPYKPLGCKHKVSGKKSVEKHLVEHINQHVALSLASMQKIQDENTALKEQQQQDVNLRKDLEKKIIEQASLQEVARVEVISFKESLRDMESDFSDVKDKVETKAQQIVDEVTKQSSESAQVVLKPIQDTLKQLDQKYESFDQKLVRLSMTAGNTGPFTEAEVNSFRRDINSYATKIEMIETNNAVLSATISDLELKLQLMENTNFTGRQLWRVDNVRHRMQQAITGKVTALHSAPCFTARNGYKFCSRLYLNGDGVGKATHLSLFFVVMRSDYDALLEWPFTHRVTFRLIDPENEANSIRETFLPDRNSSSFKRPTRDMNIAADRNEPQWKSDLGLFCVIQPSDSIALFWLP